MCTTFCNKCIPMVHQFVPFPLKSGLINSFNKIVNYKLGLSCAKLSTA